MLDLIYEQGINLIVLDKKNVSIKDRCNINICSLPFFTGLSRTVKGNVISLSSHINVNWANNFSLSLSELEDLTMLDIFILISSIPFNVP